MPSSSDDDLLASFPSDPLPNSQEALDLFGRSCEPKNTILSMQAIKKRWKTFMAARKDLRKLSAIPFEDLNNLSVLFISRLKQINGTSYNWGSFRTKVHALFMYFRYYYEKHKLGEPPDLRHHKFKMTNNALNHQLKKLRKKNKVGKRTAGLTVQKEFNFFKFWIFNNQRIFY